MGALGLAGPGAALARRRGRAGSREPAAKAEPTRPAGRGGKRLVVLLLQGGPDGLAVAAPTSDPLYAYLRPQTAILPGSGGLELGDGFLLHPALSPLFPFWKKGRLAVIPACGLVGAATEHGAARADFAYGAPTQGKTPKAGWLGRLALALGGAKAQMLTGALSPILGGAPHYKLVSAGRGPSLPPLADANRPLFEAASRLFSGRDPLDAAVAAGGKSRREGLARFLAESRQAAAGAVAAPTFARFGERFGRELADRRDVALSFLAVGGFDTHVGQGAAKGYLADRLAETAAGLAGLASGLGQAFDETVVLALGEFGRSARENAYGGTDNGRGGVMLVLGGPVAGGKLYGDWPGLGGHRLAGGKDIAVTTDWRDVAAGVLTRHLGLPEGRLAEIFPGFTPGKTPPNVMG